MARDCTVNRDPNAIHSAPPPVAKGGFDSEYASLMAELGEGGKGPGGDSGKTPWAGSAGHDITAGGSNIPPWRRPEVWQSNNMGTNQQSNGFRPPQTPYAGYSGGYPGASAPAQQWGGQAGYGQGTGYYQQSQDYTASYAQYYQNQYSQQQSGTPSH